MNSSQINSGKIFIHPTKCWYDIKLDSIVHDNECKHNPTGSVRSELAGAEHDHNDIEIIRTIKENFVDEINDYLKDVNK